MFKKLLIANRGEIAVRIIRACRDLGVSPVVVYSEADRYSLAVQLADQAHPIGGSTASESYLSVDKIIDAALATGCDALHPGYGFLAEDESLVNACTDAGVVFVGPSAASIESMGDKLRSRSLVAAAGVPVVPGTENPVATLEEAAESSREIGYPIMLKASAGGGGKGMRLVRNEDQLRSAFQMTRGEAKAAFSDSTVYLEKYLERPRHIEVQVLGDRHGNLIHLGERECSIQRRHQKLLEECPSPFVGPEMRRDLGEAALAVARAVDYTNADTVEFLVDAASSARPAPFYFLEMNTRLQVEHPVTEMVTGLDLAREQIRIAAGEKLSLSQDDVTWRGAAIECRIYAEDSANNFYPSPGGITLLSDPSGPGIRNDSGVCEGYEIPLEYDPLISKLVAHGRDRAEAIQRMRRALDEYKVAGVRTTIPFFHAVLGHERFLGGDLHTHFIDEHGLLSGTLQGSDGRLPRMMAALYHYLEAREGSSPDSTPGRRSRWKDYNRFPNLDSLEGP